MCYYVVGKLIPPNEVGKKTEHVRNIFELIDELMKVSNAHVITFLIGSA